MCSLARLSRSLRRNGLDAKAAEHLAAGLKENKALTSLGCVATRRMADCPPSIAADTRIFTLARSLDSNELGPEGAKHISKALKTNSALKELQCAAARPCLHC